MNCSTTVTFGCAPAASVDGVTVTFALEMAPSADAGTPSSAANGTIIPTSRPRKTLRIDSLLGHRGYGTAALDPAHPILRSFFDRA